MELTLIVYNDTFIKEKEQVMLNDFTAGSKSSLEDFTRRSFPSHPAVRCASLPASIL